MPSIFRVCQLRVPTLTCLYIFNKTSTKANEPATHTAASSLDNVPYTIFSLFSSVFFPKKIDLPPFFGPRTCFLLLFPVVSCRFFLCRLFLLFFSPFSAFFHRLFLPFPPSVQFRCTMPVHYFHQSNVSLEFDTI